jgi:hypothetical protein
MKLGSACQILVEPFHNQRLEVQQMTCILLNRPSLPVSAPQYDCRQGTSSILQSRGRAAQPLNHFRIKASGKSEIEPAVSPFYSPGHRVVWFS